MGFNTNIVVLNDALHMIKNDQGFGARLADAVMAAWRVDKGEQVDIPAYSSNGYGVYCNAASVVAQHHADTTSIIAMGGNCATVLGKFWGPHHTEEDKLRLLKLMAEEMGYSLRKKPAKK